MHPGENREVAAALAATAAALVRRDATISHESGSILRGLPVYRMPRHAIVTLAPHAPDGSARAIHVHRATLTADEIETWYGVPVTSVARTVTDIARRNRSAGLLTADAALREGLVTQPQLVASARACFGWPGARSAAWVATHADPRSESPLESLTRAALIGADFPTPELQVWISAAGARVDLLYREQRVVIEADGLLKYTDPDVLREEKKRHERLVRAGYRVVRVMWSDVDPDPSPAVALVRAALAPPRFSYQVPTIWGPRVGT